MEYPFRTVNIICNEQTAQVFQVAILKSLWANLRCLPLRYAIRFPILLSRSVRVSKLRKNGIQFADYEMLKPCWGG